VGRGRIERAWFLTTGTIGGPGIALSLPTSAFGLAQVRMPIAVLVVEHAGGEVTLVDTGWSAEQCRAPLRAIGPSAALFLNVRAKEGDDAASQLRARGIDPSRVTMIVATHLHNDHVGGLVDFPNAEVVTTEPELSSARERGTVHGFDVDALARVGRWTMRSVDGPSRWELPASADLGDGLLLLDVRGHTAGTIAVAATIGDHTVIHLGDAAYTLGEARRAEQSPLALRTSWDLERQKITYRAIGRLLARSREEATVITSHDPTVWPDIERRVWTA
jgi:glyoxylase-like metal-dependent hydrolase (beta-lactamase superfamily II)